ncbi:Clavaminate synthase-like protein [Aureobasidium sp. EXF-10727]|nr:Clavaminate synthase-like protein [Aureobasidium sp. EXF-10727]KAI4729662.1 Clavaminate synthase-like protein [Aureobasidium sp. EXF-10728]
MSAAVRPTTAILRKARHVPVTQCLARRWQTSAAKPASYDEMLDLMEQEYPESNKPRSHPPRTLESPQPQRPAQQQYDQQDAQQQTYQRAPRTVSHTVYRPATDSQPIQPSSNPRTSTSTTGRENTRPSPRFKPANESLPRSPRRTVTDENKPRRIPAPVYKLSPEQAADHTLSEDAVTHMSQPKSKLPEQPRPTRARSQPSQTPSRVSEALRKSPPRTRPTAKIPAEEILPTTNFNPLETVSINGSIYDNIFLRDSCTCSQCVDTSTRQKRFESADIPTNIRIRSLETESGHDSETVITWKHDVPGFGPDHVTRLSNKDLVRSTLYPVTHRYTGGKLAWNTSTLGEHMVDFDYNEYMSDEKVLHQLLKQLHVYGLVFVKNLPEAESSVVQTANRIGPLKNTFYGETWDVRSVSNAKNVAYTDVHLGFHMDLLYMQQPPRLQLLHCLRASDQGGISLFSDAYRSMQALYEMDEAAFEALCETPVNFHYDNDNHHYFRTRRTFQRRDDITEVPKNTTSVWSAMEAVNWAPPFQAPFNHNLGDVAFAKSTRAWHKAAQMFRDLTELRENVYSRQMVPGECVIFDNRRVLHARTAFAGGERWLRGAYLDDDPYLSKLRVLGRTYGDYKYRGKD